MNSYDLSRNWFDWSFENPEKVSPNHAAIYFFAIEHCNRMAWKKKFGFPTQMAMDAIGIKKHQTYIKYFNDLVEWGFFILVQKSLNQYSSNIISLNSAMPKNGNALGKAIHSHTAKQTESNGQSNSSIDKPINLEPLNNETDSGVPPLPVFNFKKSLLNYGFQENIINDWLKVRKTKRATNTEIAYKKFITEVEKSEKTPNEIMQICVENSWSGFDPAWLIKVKPQFNGKSPPYQVDPPKFSRNRPD